MQFAVASCMRNEALFLLEWIAHQRQLGFDLIIVATNDCTDGTDIICSQISKADPSFVHIENSVQPGESPQLNGMKRVLSLPLMADIDYLLHCDSDEFLNISCGTGTLPEMIDASGASDCVALAWRYFGDAGIKRWPGGLVTENCTKSAARLRPGAIMHKSMFKPSKFRSSIDHMPKDPVSKDVILTNTRGEVLNNGSLFRKNKARFRGVTNAQFTWENACIHHYAIRSEDIFLMKNLRGDGMGNENERYYLNSKFWRRSNTNRTENARPPAYLADLKKRIDVLRAIGTVGEIEQQAQVDFIKRRDEYLTPAQIEKLTLKI
jgi:hypothetical protein